MQMTYLGFLGDSKLPLRSVVLLSAVIIKTQEKVVLKLRP